MLGEGVVSFEGVMPSRSLVRVSMIEGEGREVSDCLGWARLRRLDNGSNGGDMM